MRGIKKEIVVKRRLEDVWDVVSRLGFCRRINRLLGPSFRELDFTTLNPNDAPTRGLPPELEPLVKGTHIQVMTKKGRSWADWTVTHCDPPYAITFTASDADAGTKSYFLAFQVRLKKLNDTHTQITADFTYIFLNTLIEMMTLLLPGRFINVILVDIILRRVKNSLERA